MKYTVYHLVDPNTREVKYVGKSTSPSGRHKQHIQESIERQNTGKKQWIFSLLAKGQTPVLVIVASFATEPEARERESIECHTHSVTILNIHNPTKGAKDFRKAP